jgi:hypothetical protein
LKWYIEEQTKELRQALEKKILRWYKVTCKKMFGCPCYLANGKMFVGLVTKGVIITKLTELERADLKNKIETQLFKVGGKVIKKWVRVNLDPVNLKIVMPFIEKSYEHAIYET